MIINKKANVRVMVNNEKNENDREKIIRPRLKRGRLELWETLLGEQK
jgi:hypothetical protein